MNYKRASESLRRIANKVLTQDDLASQIIIQKGNTYQAYGAYTIEETQFGWQVSSKTFDHLVIFNTAKVALAWCIIRKSGMYRLASHMEWLDSRVTAKQFDIDVITNTFENAEIIKERAILLARLTEDINSRQMYKKQLQECVESAKMIKLSKHKHGRIHRKL